MRILAYSDTHFATPETLEMLGLTVDYSFCEQLIGIIKSEKPELVICCGDFNEPYYDKFQSDIASEIISLTDIRLAGNHDLVGETEVRRSGIKFLHGHQYSNARISIEDCQLKAEQDSECVVMGHTHSPKAGKTMMDIGSVSITGTFAWIEDGRAILVRMNK